MNKISYQDFVDNYLVKNGEPGNESVFFRPPDLLKREFDDLYTVVDQLLNNANIPTWNSGTNYEYNELAVYNGVIYISLQDDNLGHTPPEAGWWKKLSFPESGGIRWRIGTAYEVGDIVDYIDASTGSYNDHGVTAQYRCTSSNLSAVGNEPNISANWEIASAQWLGSNKFVIQSGDAEPSVGVQDGDILIVWE